MPNQRDPLGGDISQGATSNHTRRAARHPDLRLAHREIIAREYLKGRYQADIAGDLGISIATVKRDLASIRQHWLKSALRDFDAFKSEQLAKIDAIESSAWEMWGRTCEKVIRTSLQEVEATKFPGRNTRTDSELGTGDPRYLQIALQCVDRRAKLLGLDAPSKVARTDTKGNDMNDLASERLRAMNNEEMDARIRELQRKSIDDMTDMEIRERVEEMTRGRFQATPTTP